MGKKEKQIIISDELLLFEIFTDNEIVQGGFDYMRNRLLTIKEAEEILNEQIFASSTEH